MKWTEIPTGQTNGAFQRFMGELGDKADVAIARINLEPVFANRLAMYAINGGIEPTSSHTSARTIMGKNFFGIEEAIKYFGINPSRRQLTCLAEIPWSEEVLTSCKDTHVLVAVLPISILEIRNKVEDNLFYSHADAWYNNQAFAKDRGETGWQLVRKTPVDKSTNKKWADQQALLTTDEETPKAQVMTYTIIGHFLATGERLFENIYVRCIDLDSDGSRVRVGDFAAEGLGVNDWSDGLRDDDIGLSSARK